MTKLGRPRKTHQELADGGFKLAEIADACRHEGLPMRLEDVADPDVVIQTTSTWRTRLSTIDQLKFKELEDVFYAAALRGASFNAILKYFGIKRAPLDATNTVSWRAAHDIEELKTAFEAGQAELQLRLRSTQIEEALTKKNPLMLIWVSKNFAGLSDDGQIDFSVAEDGTGSVAGLFTSIKANRAEDGTTLGPPVEGAIEGAGDEAMAQ